MYGVLSCELVREQGMIDMLEGLSAEARVARFLVTLAQRFAAMGNSSNREVSAWVKLQLKRKSQILPALYRLSCPACLLSDTHGLGELSISYPYFQGTFGNVKFADDFLLVHDLHTHPSLVKEAYSVSRYIFPERTFVARFLYFVYSSARSLPQE
jgi:hypothetical protein